MKNIFKEVVSIICFSLVALLILIIIEFAIKQSKPVQVVIQPNVKLVDPVKGVCEYHVKVVGDTTTRFYDDLCCIHAFGDTITVKLKNIK